MALRFAILYMFRLEVPERAQGGILLDLGLVVHDEPSKLLCMYVRSSIVTGVH